MCDCERVVVLLYVFVDCERDVDVVEVDDDEVCVGFEIVFFVEYVVVG